MTLKLDSSKATFSKPWASEDGKHIGLLWVAQIGTTLPTDLTTALDPAFRGMGYISEDGLTEAAPFSEGDSVVDSGNTTVLTADPTFQKQWSGAFLQVADEDVLRTLWGDENVTVTNGMIKVEEKAISPTNLVCVIEERWNSIPGLPRGRHVRYVMPSVQFMLSDDTTHNATTAMTYAWTANCYPTVDQPACIQMIETVKTTDNTTRSAEVSSKSSKSSK